MARLLLFALAAQAFSGWTHRFARGGSLWELRDATCAPVRVTAHRRGVASVDGRDWRMEGTFEFAQRRARLRGSMQWTGDGGFGLSGTSALTEPLEVTERTLRLSGRVLYLEKPDCEREAKAP